MIHQARGPDEFQETTSFQIAMVIATRLLIGFDDNKLC